MQSEFCLQTFDCAHGGQEPPQSTSVSFPLVTPSLQAGAAQIPVTQTAEAQSPPEAQRFPVGHF